MQVFTTEIIFQPNPNSDFTNLGNIHQTYTFTRETLAGIRDAYESVFRSLRPRLAVTLLDLPQPGLEMLTPFSGLLDCNPEGVFDLSQRRRYILYFDSLKEIKMNCVYTFDTLDYLSGFFYVFTLFQRRPLNLKLYDLEQRSYVQIPYPEGM